MATLKRWNGAEWVPVGADTFLDKTTADNTYAPIRSGSVDRDYFPNGDLERETETTPAGSRVTEFAYYSNGDLHTEIETYLGATTTTTHSYDAAGNLTESAVS